MDPDIFVPIAGMVTGLILGFPIIRTVTRLVERKALGQSSRELDALRAEVRELRDAVDAAGDLHERLVDLEERADFTDRLLTQGRARGSGGSEGRGET